MSDDYNFDDVLPGHEKHKKLVSKLMEIESDELVNTISNTSSTSSFLPSSMIKEKKPKKNKEYDPDDWFNEMMGVDSIKVNKRKNAKGYDFFENDVIFGKKKKKKKKKDKDGLIDFNKEFEPELALYKNLLIAQNRFTDDLQKEYDSITSSKSTSRGITKQLADLIENITDARALSMQLVEKNVNAKKLIAELTMKQKKENGIGEDGENMADFASNYLKQMLNERQNLLSGNGDNTVSEYTDDEMFDILSDTLESSDEELFNRSEETDAYLKYENQNVKIYVVITDNDVENYEFIAKNQDGVLIPDYPLPFKTKISINRSTNIATDTYGQKFNIIWN